MVFADAGTAFPSLSERDFDELGVGVGGGIRLDTPIALFRLDYGVPLNKDVGVEDNWVFTIGHAF